MMKSITRRQILKIGVQASFAMLCPLPLRAATKPTDSVPRSLSFFNTHTNESLDVCYYKNGRYDKNALERINFILRDHRSGEIRSIDVELLNLLNKVASNVEKQKPFHIISGYRSPATNAMLQKTTNGVASKSLHLVGKAIDVRLPNFSTLALRDICLDLKGGGVGYYSRSDFVHLDTGRVRRWGS
jgi:uncharacterized protein YcbK (DUF882 family)